MLLAASTVVACGSSSDVDDESATGDSAKFCEVLKQSFVRAVQEGAEPLSADYIGEAVDLAPSEELRRNLSRATETPDGEADNEAFSAFADAFAEVSQLCDPFPPVEGYGLDFAAPQEPTASSAIPDIRKIDPIERTVPVDEDEPLTVSFSGGTTCVSGPLLGEECVPGEGRAGVTVVETGADEMLVLGPGTNEASIAVRDAAGTEVQAEMLSPHVWQIDTETLQQPLAARIGDYQCFGIGLDDSFESNCQHRDTW